jgi:hypothetical protein
MLITVRRDIATLKSTTSEVSVDGVRECYFLEDPCREKFIDGEWVWKPEYKIKGNTCIPSGLNPLIIDYSSRFKRRLPHIIDVPDFTWIRIHSGNDAGDTEGCPLPGVSRNTDWVSESRKAFNLLFEKIHSAFEGREDIDIEFLNEFEPIEGLHV